MVVQVTVCCLFLSRHEGFISQTDNGERGKFWMVCAAEYKVLKVLKYQKHFHNKTAWLQAGSASHAETKVSSFVLQIRSRQNEKSRLATVKLSHVSYLIVPVGEGTGETNVESDCGMFIRSGGGIFVRGGLGTRLGVSSLTNDVNRTFTFVDGNRKTQLKQTWQKYLKSLCLVYNTWKDLRNWLKHDNAKSCVCIHTHQVIWAEVLLACGKCRRRISRSSRCS